MILYIYGLEDLRVIAQVEGDTNDECEKEAERLNYDTDELGWTYLEPSAQGYY